MQPYQVTPADPWQMDHGGANLPSLAARDGSCRNRPISRISLECARIAAACQAAADSQSVSHASGDLRSSDYPMGASYAELSGHFDSR